MARPWLRNRRRDAQRRHLHRRRQRRQEVEGVEADVSDARQIGGDPLLPLHNNLAEREIRGVVIGRKNHYGSKSERGTEVAAIFYSLLEAAYLCGVDPKSCLAEAARRAIREPGTVTLPHGFR